MTALPVDLELTDGVVRLRRWSHDDIEALTEIWQDRELQRRFDVESPVTREAVSAYVDGVRARWRDGLQVSLAVVVGGALVGGCDLDHLDAEAPDLGYWVAAPSRRRGYATRVARLMLDWASTALDLGVVDVEVEPDNAASIAVAARLGFTRVPGVERRDDARRLEIWRWTRR